MSSFCWAVSDDSEFIEPTFATAAPVKTIAFDSARFHILASERAEQPARALAPELEQLRDEVAQLIGRDWKGSTEVRVASR